MAMMSEWYSRNDDLAQSLLGVKGVGLCGAGSDRCYDVAGPGRDTQLLSVLPSTHPDYNAGLARLTKELNRAFSEQAEELLRRFLKEKRVEGDVHMAVAASRDRLYLTYAAKIPPAELAKKGAKIAEERLRSALGRVFRSSDEPTRS